MPNPEFQLDEFLKRNTKEQSVSAVATIEREALPFHSNDNWNEISLESSNGAAEEILLADDQTNYEKKYNAFFSVCAEVQQYMQKKMEEDSEKWLETQKNAILGHPKEVQVYMDHIDEYLTRKNKKSIETPYWYDNLIEGVFHENWGLAGLQEWIKNPNSSSCKVIQPRIYFLENGVQQLKPQSLSKNRYERLKKALLLSDTSKRMNDPYQEVYMLDGTRIEIYNNTKQGTIIFRKYVIKSFRFENLARLKSIDPLCIPMLEAMVACGFNVNMIGPVRSGKTTFLTTYQSYERPELEGVLLETDPEIPLHDIMPKSPIIQMIADNEELDGILKPLMRSDGDYLIMGEARDGRALRQMLMITKKGTRRVKGTFHTGFAEDFCYDIAQEIVNIYGGDVRSYMIQAAKGFNFLFEFASSSENRGEKKLKGIHEICLDMETLMVSTNQICRYNLETKDWEYNGSLSERTLQLGLEEDENAIVVFQDSLIRLAKEKPMTINPQRISPFSMYGVK